MRHPQFMDDHLQKGFKFAFEGAFKNNEIIFEVFKNSPGVSRILEPVLKEVAGKILRVKEEIRRAEKQRELLAIPDQRTADDFDLGRGNVADQAMARTAFTDYQQSKGTRDQLRKTELAEKEANMFYLNDLNQQILVLNRLKDHFLTQGLVAGMAQLEV